VSCPDRYDLFITNGEGEGHGLICDWDRGGAGLKVDAPASLESTAVSTKGDYGVRDAKDAFRIVQSDWSEGAGQKSYDRDQDSESAFWESKSIDTSTIGTIRLGPGMVRTPLAAIPVPDLVTLPYIIAALTDSGTPLVFAAVTGSPFIKYSSDGVTWTAITGTVGDEVCCFATDGQYIYAVRVDSGAIHKGAKTGWATHSSDGSNAGFTHVAFASGVLYAAKGAAGTAALLGAFNGASPDVWTVLTPDAGKNINASGVTFGLVAVGNYVYWGVTNGMVTKVYKALQGGGAVKDEVTEVCSFPTGFVGATLYSYLNTVYVGGHFDAATVNTGIGAIYAIINDSPALLTEVGDDKTVDNRVLAMSAYERNLFFVANSQLWRWDLKYGGYSQWAGPLNSTSVTLYDDLVWIGTWDMAAAPGTGAEPDTTIQLLNGATASYDGQASFAITDARDQTERVLIFSLVNDPAGGTGSISDTTGTTVELDLPTNALTRWGTGPMGGAIHFGLNGSAKSAWVRLVLDPADGYTYTHCDLYSGNNRNTDDTLIASSNGWIANTNTSGVLYGADDDTELTVRLTLKNGTANVYLYSATLGTTKLLCSGKVGVAPTTPKMVFLKFMRSAKQDTTPPWGNIHQYGIVNRLRWCDDGAYAPDLPTTVTGVGLACARDAVWTACTAYGVAVTTPGYFVPGGDELPASLTFSETAGNMPTVDKYFSAFHVQLENELPDACSLSLGGTIDGKAFSSTEDVSLSTETMKVFRLGITGRSIRPVLTLISSDDDYTPVVTDTAVLFTPMPKTARMHTYYIRCWQNVEGRTPKAKWDEKASVVADWLEGIANTIVTVDRPGGSSYQGKVEGLEYLEAPPSRKANGREGLYQLTVRQV